MTKLLVAVVGNWVAGLEDTSRGGPCVHDPKAIRGPDAIASSNHLHIESSMAVSLLEMTSALLRWLGIVSVTLVLFAISLVVYRLFFHPLARIPGPRWAAVSNFWLASQVRNGRMLVLGKTIHRDNGPVVRVGPNEVWFSSKEAFAKIYSATQGYEKSDFYLATALIKPKIDWSSLWSSLWRGCGIPIVEPDSLDLLSERNMDRYRLQRKLIGPLYQPSNLKRYETVVDEVLTQAIDKLRQLGGAQVDLKEWMHIITIECLGAICLSWSPGYLKEGTDCGSSNHAYIGWRRKSVFGLFPLMVVIESYSRAIGRLFARCWGVTFRTPEGFRPFFPPIHVRAMKRVKAGLRSEPPPKKGGIKVGQPHSIYRDLTADLIHLHKEKPEFSMAYLRRMIVTNFGAGHETTTSTLTAVLALIGANPKVQKRVQNELETRIFHEGSVSYSDVLNLPYTMAAIKEAQRLYPVLGMNSSRKTPTEGAWIQGYWIPGGTTVGCNPISLHRNPEIYGPDAEAFRPERWLTDSHCHNDNKFKNMDRYNLIWGGGARTCPGRNLAYMIVYKVVAALVREFDIETTIPPGDELEMYFMAILTGVKVRFLAKREETACD